MNAFHKTHIALNPRLHKKTKQPADWLRLEGTKELINEFSNSGDLHS
ncbi:MAG: KilA-N domain-containing protein [Oceanospirillaceae bacterium]|nr:KilA-N domain-containing protein [Oceanospirillaceae bacterium]